MASVATDTVTSSINDCDDNSNSINADVDAPSGQPTDSEGLKHREVAREHSRRECTLKRRFEVCFRFKIDYFIYLQYTIV